MDRGFPATFVAFPLKQILSFGREVSVNFSGEASAVVAVAMTLNRISFDGFCSLKVLLSS